jgi:hypothetical protein
MRDINEMTVEDIETYLANRSADAKRETDQIIAMTGRVLPSRRITRDQWEKLDPMAKRQFIGEGQIVLG